MMESLRSIIDMPSSIIKRNQCNSNSRKSPSPLPQSSHLSLLIVLSILAFFATTCSSFIIHQINSEHRTSLSPSPFGSTVTTTTSRRRSNSIESSSVNGNIDDEPDAPWPQEEELHDKEIVSTGDIEKSGEYQTISNGIIKSLNFNDVAESSAPPLNFEKYLTMQSKRVPVTIRYSAESGLKPYYLTVAKKVKDQYPDVVIGKVEVESVDGNGNDNNNENNYDKPKSVNSMATIGPSKTFEVIVDGKIIVRTSKSIAQQSSVFVSMNEIDIAIHRARKRRRPSTVYGDGGKLSGTGDGIGDKLVDDHGQLVKTQLQALKIKATELQQRNRIDTKNE